MTTCTDHAFSTFFARLYHLGNPFVLFTSKQRDETKIGKEKLGFFAHFSCLSNLSSLEQYSREGNFRLMIAKNE